MQTTGMLRGTRAIYFLALLAPLVDNAHSYPYQILPSIPGYIPVYIRNGDQPLEEINPALAEAFQEHSGLSKSIRLDHNFSQLESIEESRANSVVDESRKKYYPAYARESGNSIAGNEKREEEDTHAEKNPGFQVPKLVSLYELHEKLKKAQKEDQLKDGSDFKVSLEKVSSILSTEKRDNSDRLSTEIEKEESKPNDLYDPNPNYPELPAEIGHNRDTPQDFVSVIGLESLTEQPNVRQYKDLSHLTEEKNAVDDKNTKEEEPVKEQRPSDILSNVQKLSPIAPPEAYASQKSDEKVEKKTEKKTDSKTETLTTQEPTPLFYKDLSHLSNDQKVIESSNKKDEKSEKEEETSSDAIKDTVVKETAKEKNPTNVYKLSPIAPPEAYETEEKTTKNKVEEKPINTSLVHLPIHQPMVHLYKDLSHLSNDEEETATEKENETPIKVESPYNVSTNVFKLSPIAPPEAYSKKDDQDIVPSAILMQEIVHDDEKAESHRT
ncbi:uncharacterized protein LOC122520293 isoform X1 [Polistes fuscatus]|uniref:uncharacterized protein LOC122520293 isoform X1 n=1 Tax=Polistes fuscatus TaxID=30207 RepID=UPI001CA7EE83|nr:uncharacterized protein LOC122520293 isoform X1 [Polistes fuscatus]